MTGEGIPEFLADKYDESFSLVGSGDTISTDIGLSDKALLDTILKYSEQAKGVLTVFVTSIVYKIFYPNQDIRYHQEGLHRGYSGRTFDTKYITPFLKSRKFPAMAESGWLTRSLEQKAAYDENYKGAITPGILKDAFLSLVRNLQEGKDPEKYLDYIIQGLILQRNRNAIDLAKPTALPINVILDLLDTHFNAKYQSDGASRLPVLAIYAIYECLIKEARRFEGKKLLPMESHTSADMRSGRIGDIEIIDGGERVFEAVEVKHGISITMQLVLDSYTKFQTTPVSRYYILSTAPKPKAEDWERLQKEIQRIRNVHGCQVIVNGIMQSINYYLRLLDDTFEFVNNYVTLLENDQALKFEHKQKWNEIIGELG